MTQRACEKCGEMVSAAKAFCPACGHAFVEEETRDQATEFQQLDGTMQVGKTMYNQMLSEMGLNISGPSEHRAEPVKPVMKETSPPAEAPRAAPAVKAEVIKPISTDRPAPAVDAPRRKDRTRLLLIIGAAVIAGWLLVIMVLAFFAILPRLR